jgi:hypothetical protein
MPHRGTVFYRSHSGRVSASSARRSAPLVVPFCHRLHEPTRPGHVQAFHHYLNAKGSPHPWVQAPRTSRHTRGHHQGGGTREHRVACHRHQLPWARWRSSTGAWPQPCAGDPLQERLGPRSPACLMGVKSPMGPAYFIRMGNKYGTITAIPARHERRDSSDGTTTG